MIKDFEGNKYTPRQMAKKMIFHSLDNAFYQLENQEGLTEKENEEIIKQLDSLVNKLITNMTY